MYSDGTPIDDGSNPTLDAAQHSNEMLTLRDENPRIFDEVYGGVDVQRIFDDGDAGAVHEITIQSAPLGIILESDSHGYNTNIAEITTVKKKDYQIAGIEEGMIISRLNNVNVLGLPFNIVKKKMMSRLSLC